MYKSGCSYRLLEGMNQILLHKFHQFCCRRRLHFPYGGSDADLKGRGSVERQCHNRSIP